jgi:hypothetical protein
MNGLQSKSKILFLGETRSAYVKHPAIVSSTFDQNPLWRWVSEAQNSAELLHRFRRENVEFIFCNWKEYARVAEKVGMLPVDILPPAFAAQLKLNGRTRTGLPLQRLDAKKRQMVKEFFSRYSVFEWRHGDHLFFLRIQLKGD